MLSHKEKIIYWIWLTELPLIGTVTVRKIWNHIGNIEMIYSVAPSELLKISGIRKKQVEIFTEQKSLKRAESILTQCEFLGIKVMTVEMEDYPERCRHLSDISPVLYCRGRNIINNMKTVGIIGKRRCTEDGKKQTILLAQEKSQKGYGIISGFAKGIDSYAHTAAIKEGGYTVGVLGNGIDICYPKEQMKLQEAIKDTGLLISQYPPGTMPQKYTFPVRNKLIAALSDELYVMEKGQISGTQSTIDAAWKYGKEIHIR